MVAPVAGVGAINPVTAQIPNFVLQQMQAARMQQMAAALSDDGMKPIDYDPRGRISWTQGLAKILQTGVGAKMGSNAITQQAGLTQQGMQAMGQAYGMGQPQGQPPSQGQSLAAALSPQIASQNALSQGAQQGSVGPTVANGARMDAMTPPALPQAPQIPQAPQPPQVDPAMGGARTPLNPFGAPPLLAWQAGQGDASAMEAYKTLLANQAATPEMKNNAAFGITADQARAMAFSKATNDGFHAFNPGESWTNTFTGAGGFAPKLPDNSQPNAAFTPGSPIPSVGVVPGAQGVTQANAQSGALGTTSGSVHTVTNLDGSSSTGTGSNLGLTIPPQVQGARDSDALAILKQERAKPGNSVGDNAALDREISRAQTRGGVVTGPNASFAPMIDQGKKLLGDAQSAQTNNQSTYAYLDEMKNLAASGAAFGPGTANIAKWKALANNYVPGIDLTGAQTNQDVMHKLAATLAGSQTPRSDADLANWQARYPSGELTNAAVQKLIPILQKQANVVDARANVMTRASSAGLDKLPEVANRFNQIASPSLVADGQALAQASKNGTVPQFMQQYKAQHQDWQSRMGQIQQLDGLGAF